MRRLRAQRADQLNLFHPVPTSAYQVTHNVESKKLQYAMQDRLRQLGWREIEVIDEDLGRSAAGTQTRTRFERMVAEVCLVAWARLPREKCHVVPATAESGSNWLKYVGSSTRY
jgi:hypothetical protein